MRIERAIDRYLQQMQVERDWTASSIRSIYRSLILLADDYPDTTIEDFDGRPGLEKVRDHVARRYGHLSSTTRATRISYLHTFFAWAETEGFIEDDQVRKIRRPPKRRPDVYRPTASELLLGERACTARELAPWALMSRRGFRASTVCALRWADLDLARGRARIQVKGGHRDIVPLEQELLAAAGITQTSAIDAGTPRNTTAARIIAAASEAVPPTNGELLAARKRRRAGYTSDEVTAAIRRFVDEHGYPPAHSDILVTGYLPPPRSAARALGVGSWADVIEKLGYPRPTKGTNYKRPVTRVQRATAPAAPPPVAETSVTQPEPTAGTSTNVILEVEQVRVMEPVDTAELRDLATGLADAAGLLRHRAILSPGVRAAIAQLLEALSDELEAAA